MDKLWLDKDTGVYREEIFCDNVRNMLNERPGMDCAMVRMDIVRFQLINDLMGMEQGDRVLADLGGILRALAAQENCPMVYGRIRADVFALCFPHDEVREERIAGFCTDRLNECYPSYDLLLRFGIYVIEDPSEAVEVMIDRANMAARTIRGDYRHRYAYYDSSMREEMLWEQQISSDMGAALQKGQFYIVLQPKCEMATGKVVGAEALVRWRHPGHGEIPPAEFIPVLERNGLVYQLDSFVWEETCRLLRMQLDAGGMAVPISVNVSRADLLENGLYDRLTSLVRHYRLPEGLLELEITESVGLEQPAPYLNVVHRLRKSGFPILLDDFGSAYSTLNILSNMDIDILKVDLKSISQYQETGRRKEALLTSISFMANQLGMDSIIEGVETAEEKEFLQSVGFELVQGYYFYKPMPVQEYLDLLAREEKAGS